LRIKELKERKQASMYSEVVVVVVVQSMWLERVNDALMRVFICITMLRCTGHGCI
jgi:hypothetical protein